MKMMKKLKEQVVAECRVDDEGLWRIVRQVESAFPLLKEDKIRKITIGIIQNLLNDGSIIAGIPRKGVGFIEWNLTVEQAIARIEKEWGELGCTPDIGDIVWFTTPGY